ncbi:VCBS domain-containing protein, partial [Hoeflea alexandrii]|uniref:VCBS domain-containing protein n=1 Tax=Hoeflea alexandrii TaxID=288436 RepID=UPI0022AF4419
ATLANGYVLTAGQEATLLGAFSLDDLLDGVSNSTFGDGSGEIAWTYDATNAAIDFLGENDQLVLTFTVTVDDQNGGTASQDVTITINGTNDAPVIDAGSVVAGAVTESGDIAGINEAGFGGALSSDAVLSGGAQALLAGL